MRKWTITDFHKVATFQCIVKERKKKHHCSFNHAIAESEINQFSSPELSRKRELWNGFQPGGKEPLFEISLT